MEVDFGWSSPFGLLTPAAWVAMFATRYMHEYGATSEDFGRVAVISRKYAANNPAAFFHGKPITLEEHQASRWIAKPVRLLDCCQESDGGQAILVTTLARARDLRQTPAVITASAQGSCDDQQMMKSYYRKDITGVPELKLCADQLYADSGLSAADIQAAILYDHFSPLVLPQLEEFGFCQRGEAKDFVRDGNLDGQGRVLLDLEEQIAADRTHFRVHVGIVPRCVLQSTEPLHGALPFREERVQPLVEVLAQVIAFRDPCRRVDLHEGLLWRLQHMA